ncbi:MAG: TerB family tellurite resistance protein [Rhizobiaceae bacterium]
MFERLISFLGELPGQHPETGRFSPDDPRVAAAALMFHVMDADGVRRDDETASLREILSSTYDMTGQELDELMRAGEDADQEAIDLYAFTSVLKRHLDHAARAEFIRIMWQIVYADGELHELEDNIVWRVAELIGIEQRERIALRQQVQHESGGDRKHPAE